MRCNYQFLLYLFVFYMSYRPSAQQPAWENIAPNIQRHPRKTQKRQTTGDSIKIRERNQNMYIYVNYKQLKPFKPKAPQHSTPALFSASRPCSATAFGCFASRHLPRLSLPSTRAGGKGRIDGNISRPTTTKEGLSRICHKENNKKTRPNRIQ